MSVRILHKIILKKFVLYQLSIAYVQTDKEREKDYSGNVNAVVWTSNSCRYVDWLILISTVKANYSYNLILAIVAIYSSVRYDFGRPVLSGIVYVCGFMPEIFVKLCRIPTLCLKLIFIKVDLITDYFHWLLVPEMGFLGSICTLVCIRLINCYQ
jgi:hypothetical protein